MIGAGNGQWVRARNEASAKAFLAEREQEAEQIRERRERSAALWRQVASRVRRWFRPGQTK